jgi:hypothetical protein
MLSQVQELTLSLTVHVGTSTLCAIIVRCVCSRQYRYVSSFVHVVVSSRTPSVLI